MKAWWVGVLVACGGEPEVPPRSLPALVIEPAPRTLAVGDTFACAIAPSHRLACWGKPPAALANIDDALQVAIAGERACVVRALGEVACDGQVVRDLPPATRIAIGIAGSCIAVADGSAWCWREGERPARVDGIRDAVDVAVQRERACVLRATGRVACFAHGDALHELPETHVVELDGAPEVLVLRLADGRIATRWQRVSGDADVRLAGAVAARAFRGGAIAVLLDGTAVEVSRDGKPTALPRVRGASELASNGAVACVRARRRRVLGRRQRGRDHRSRRAADPARAVRDQPAAGDRAVGDVRAARR